jgi:hypothetical protein
MNKTTLKQILDKHLPIVDTIVRMSDYDVIEDHHKFIYKNECLILDVEGNETGIWFNATKPIKFINDDTIEVVSFDEDVFNLQFLAIGDSSPMNLKND